MKKKILENKPLVEAIFEAKWELQEPKAGIKIDPHYKLLIGRIYEKVKEEYPFHEQLPTVNMPDEIAGYIVQHRFRKDKDAWPLIQLGPGIITLNDTEGYVWKDFEKRIGYLIEALFEKYLDSENSLKINWLQLRYIDAVEFNYQKNNVFDFLKDNLKVSVNIYENLFKETGVNDLPSDLDLRISYSTKKPEGSIDLRFFRGKGERENALMWETIVRSIGEDAPKNKDKIESWIIDSHNLCDDWFFKMIEGELFRRFE